MAKKEKKKEIAPFNDFEETCMIGAIRYYMGRQTIVSATFPSDFIISRCHHRLSKNMLSCIVRDLKEHRKMYESFGDKTIDDRPWLKFTTYLDCFQNNSFKKVTLIDDTECEVFSCEINERVWERDDNGYPIGDPKDIIVKKIYPRERYESSPYHEIYIPEENIKSYD